MARKFKIGDLVRVKGEYWTFGIIIKCAKDSKADFEYLVHWFDSEMVALLKSYPGSSPTSGEDAITLELVS